MAVAKAAAGEFHDTAAVLPQYLRDADTRINWQTRARRAGVEGLSALGVGATRARPPTTAETPRGRRPRASPEAVRIVPLRRRHLRPVVQIEEANYPQPWTSTVFLSEIAQRRSRRYTVATIGPLVVGYSGLMVVVEDGHITTLTVDTALAPSRHRDGAAPRPGARRLGLWECAT